jgi:uncharacterized protein
LVAAVSVVADSAAADSVAAAEALPAAAHRGAGEVSRGQGSLHRRKATTGPVWWRVFALALALAVGVAHAEIPVPELHARVTDLTGSLGAQQIASLDAELAALEQRKGAQIAVLMIPTLVPPNDVPSVADPEDIAAFATRVFDRWKLGRKGVDDGVLLIVVKDDHKVRLEVGYGLEGAIPDAAVARIIREYIAPRFRAGDYFGGIHDATTVLAGLIDGEPLPPPLDQPPATPGTSDGSSADSLWPLLLGTAFASCLLGFLLGCVLRCLFNIFPVQFFPVNARRIVGALAGPALIVALIVFSKHVVADVVGDEMLDTPAGGASQVLLAMTITGWLGWKLAPEGASRQWFGGLTAEEVGRGLATLIVDLVFSLLLSIVFGKLGDVVSVGGGGGGGGFSGGGGRSGGGGASGKW